MLFISNRRCGFIYHSVILAWWSTAHWTELLVWIKDNESMGYFEGSYGHQTCHNSVSCMADFARLTALLDLIKLKLCYWTRCLMIEGPESHICVTVREPS